MRSHLYWIAQLPPTPQLAEPQALSLRYEPDLGGVFVYGDQPLNLTYRHQTTIVNNTQPEGITTTTTTPAATQLQCSLWVTYSRSHV